MVSEADYQLQKRTVGHRHPWPTKTVDLGDNGITVSANPLGQIYQISSSLGASNKFGIMVAAMWPQFDHSQRTNPNYVRFFRKIPEEMLKRQSSGLGIGIEGPKGPVVFKHVKNSIGSHAQFEYQIIDRNLNLFVQTALKVHDHGTVTHASKVTNMSNKTQRVPVTLDLAFAVSRASYGQLTDRGAVDIPEPANVLMDRRGKNGAGVLTIANHDLGAQVLVHITFCNESASEYINVAECLYARHGVQQHPPCRPIRAPKQDILLGPSQTLKLTASFLPEEISPSIRIDPLTKLMERDIVAPDDLFSHQDGLSESHQVAKRHDRELCGHNLDSAETIESTIFWTNVNYILGCCVVPISSPAGDGVCCVADHFALNLGWPRDNYWQIRLLRKLDSKLLARLFPNNPETAVQYDSRIRQALTNHLTWLFQMAVTQIEIDGDICHFWRRSYLVNGMPKDGQVFQLDTQCYPFLELCEYFEAYIDDPAAKFIVDAILRTGSFRNVLYDLLSRRDPTTNLVASDETPADDDLGDYKFHLSSNILLWHTLRKLGKLLSYPQFVRLAPVEANALLNLAADIKESIQRNFISPHAFPFLNDSIACQAILAYGFDPSKGLRDPSRYRYYHDGNDMPTLYAQEWGFLKSNSHDGDDPYLRQLWKNTMIWAFTPGPASAGYNSGYQGDGTEPFHGLGSDHSPGPWTLGFFQQWKFAEMIGDKAWERKASWQIAKSVQFDGTFSEAVDIRDGRTTSKTWFSWPGAMIAENLLIVPDN